MDTATKARLDAAKSASKKVVHKTAEATGELMGNNIVEEIVKTKPAIDKNTKKVQEIVIPPGKRQETLNELRQVL